MEDPRHPGRAGQYPALLLSDHAETNPGRRVPVCGQHPRRGSQGNRCPDRERGLDPALQVHRLPRGAKRVKLGIDRITTKGWQDTPLRRTVDMIVLGSVAKDDKGFVIEAKFYTSGGQLILSQITRARDTGAITSAAREIAANVMERFPFEGAIVAVEGGSYRVNIGKPYRVSRGTELTLTAAARSEAGKATEYRETGRLKVKRAEDAGSLAEVEDLKKGEKIKVGDRVVRRVSLEGKEERARTNFFPAADGGPTR